MLSLNSNNDLFAIKPNLISDYLTSAANKELGVKTEVPVREETQRNDGRKPLR